MNHANKSETCFSNTTRWKFQRKKWNLGQERRTGFVLLDRKVLLNPIGLVPWWAACQLEPAEFGLSMLLQIEREWHSIFGWMAQGVVVCFVYQSVPKDGKPWQPSLLAMLVHFGGQSWPRPWPPIWWPKTGWCQILAWLVHDTFGHLGENRTCPMGVFGWTPMSTEPKKLVVDKENCWCLDSSWIC